MSAPLFPAERTTGSRPFSGPRKPTERRGSRGRQHPASAQPRHLEHHARARPSGGAELCRRRSRDPRAPHAPSQGIWPPPPLKWSPSSDTPGCQIPAKKQEGEGGWVKGSTGLEPKWQQDRLPHHPPNLCCAARDVMRHAAQAVQHLRRNALADPPTLRSMLSIMRHKFLLNWKMRYTHVS